MQLKNLKDVKQLIQAAKSAPSALRTIAIVAAVDLLIILLAVASLEDDVDERAQHADDLRAQLADTEKKIKSTRAEIDGLPDLRKQFDKALKADVLADQDRSKFIDLAKSLVEQNRLSEFRFRLDPETAEALPATKLQLVSTNVELSTNGMVDADVFAFWDEFLVQSQAHYQVTKADIELGTISLKSALPLIRAGQTPALIKSDIAFRWQSMRVPAAAAKTAEAGAPAAAAPAAAPAETATTPQPALTPQATAPALPAAPTAPTAAPQATNAPPAEPAQPATAAPAPAAIPQPAPAPPAEQRP